MRSKKGILADGLVVGGALAAAAVAYTRPPVPAAAGIVACLVGAGSVVVRRPVLVVVAAVVVVGALAHRADAVLDRPVPEGPVRAWAMVRRDPEVVGVATRLDVEIAGRRYEASGYGAVGRALAPRLVGERVLVVGSIRRLTHRDAFSDQRHLVGRLTVTEVLGRRGARGPYAWANALRRTLTRGAATLPAEQRALFSGFVIGDDRGESDAIADDFRGAGLGHLLAVSGENVAFVVAVIAPVLRRLTYRVRYPLLVAALGYFALVTRFEPSVLRATVMHLIAAGATALGRRSSGRRTLALTVIVLVLVDPFIVHSLGFALSVLATAGIIELAPHLAERLPLPAVLATPVAITLAAQIGVAPIEATRFGGVPLASVPANVVAAPLAGPIMVWGLTGGLLAGLAPRACAYLLHLPDRVLITAIVALARESSSWHLGELGLNHLVLIGVLSFVLAPRQRWGRVLRTCCLVAVILAPAAALRAATPVDAAVAPGISVSRSAGFSIVVVGPVATEARTFEALRRAGVGTIDLVVATAGDRHDSTIVFAIRQRHHVRDVWAPLDHRVRGARTPAPGIAVAVGAFSVKVGASTDRLDVTITRVGSPP